MDHWASASVQILSGMCILDLSYAELHVQIQEQPLYQIERRGNKNSRYFIHEVVGVLGRDLRILSKLTKT